MAPGPKASSEAARTVSECRVCGSKRLHPYLDMGRTPLANAYLSAQEAGRAEFTEELRIQLCRDCGLSQLTKVVHPDRMFRHYLYVSSTTATIREHFGGFARAVAEAAGAKPGDLALDIASNDGCLLKAFQGLGLEALGVDPAENLAREANARGLRTECAYWSRDAASDLARRFGRPKIITAANVFAHVDDLHGFMRGVDRALAAGGVFAIECPYALDFIEKNEFDTAYHEHLSYIALSPLSALMKARGFQVFDVDYFPDIHGGTIRACCCRLGERRPSERLGKFLAREEAFGIREPRAYDEFSSRVRANRTRLRELISGLDRKCATVWAYGASAKGNTLMNFFGLRAGRVPKVIDDNSKKWGLLTPGARMEIVGIDALKAARVDYLLLLAWNFEREIGERCRRAGYEGGFILPVPEARVKE